jgi:hypothetical protein
MKANDALGDSVELSPDRIYEILAHEYRRHVLCVLHSRPGPVEVEELASLVTARSQDVPIGDVEENDRDAVLVELHHNHLPRLRAADLIRYDRATTDRVELVSDLQPILPSLRAGGNDVREYHVD